MGAGVRWVGMGDRWCVGYKVWVVASEVDIGGI